MGEHFKPFVRRKWEVGAVLGAVIACVILRNTARGPWATPGPKPLAQQADPGIAQYLLANGDVLALAQMAAGSLALFAILSAVAHASSGRWLSGFGKDGLMLGSAGESRLAEVQEELARVRRARDEALKALEEAEELIEALMVERDENATSEKGGELP
jgi:hypothetical protein